MKNIKNIAVIAHVDHGKTTLVDALLRQSGIFRDNQKLVDRVLDKSDLEKERGITISAKCTSIPYNNFKLNLVDTPGHADFGGEVERILGMVEGALLLVDSSEGVMPQTKFVLGKALNLGLKLILVVNKIDKKNSRPEEVINDVFDLFVSLNATEEQLDFPIIYCSGKSGWSINNISEKKENMLPLIDCIINNISSPKSNTIENFSMLSSIIENDPFLGRVITGKIKTGIIKPNITANVLDTNNNIIETTRLTKVLSYHGIDRVPLDEAKAGDIIAIAGLQKANVSHTICSPDIIKSIPAPSIDPPIMSITFSVNDSPLAGKEGDKVTSRNIRNRLYQEAEGNIAISVNESENKDSFDVSGRGELQLSILIETMRREGFELSISQPKILYQFDSKTKRTLEPIEEVLIDVDSEYSGNIVEKLSQRGSILKEIFETNEGKQRLKFLCPSKSLIGYHGEFLTDTKGTGVLSKTFHDFAEKKDHVRLRKNGVMVSTSNGKAVPYALWNLEDRGSIIIEANSDVYSGMIIGEHSKSNDLEVNPLKNKQLTNIRASGKDEAIRLSPIKEFTLEKAIAYINDDELVEVTPKSIRLRKKLLIHHERKKELRKKLN